MTADTSKSSDLHAHPEVGASPAASKDAPTDEAVMVNIAGNAQDLERAKEHARLLLKRVAAGPVGDGLSHAEYALLCLYAHVATLTAQLEAERAAHVSDVHTLQMAEAEAMALVLSHEAKIERETARADAAEKERDAAKAILREHHNWHEEVGAWWIKTETGEFIELNMSVEYGDSGLCERTFVALDGDPLGLTYKELRDVRDIRAELEKSRADAAVAEAKALREGIERALNCHAYVWVDRNQCEASRVEYDGDDPNDILRATLAQPADGGK